MNKQRQKAEELIYKIMDDLDSSQMNSTYYKKLFATMSDKEFTKFCSGNLPFRFQTRPFEIEPTMKDATNALKHLDVPLLEKVALPYLYTNHNGQPVMTHPAMVLYIHVKKMKQFITKKNSTPLSIDNRDMKSGMLVSFDKGAKTSDREMESLAVMGLDHTMKEMSTWRADYMNAKSEAYQRISLTGTISEDDIHIEEDDSLSKSMLNSYMLSSLINTNILNQDYMLPRTVKNKTRKVEREV